MDPNNPIVKLCVGGMRAEGEGRFEDARFYELASRGIDQLANGRYSTILRSAIDTGQKRIQPKKNT